MQRYYIFNLIFFLVFLFFLVDCHGPIEQSFLIFFTGNILSQTEPCGCSTNRLGGLDKLAGLIELENKSTPSFFLVSGNSFFPTEFLPRELKLFWSLKAKLVYETLSVLSPTAVLVGRKDLALGREFLSRLSETKKLPLISSNLFSSEGTFLFTGFILKKTPTLEIGILGLTGNFKWPQNNYHREEQGAVPLSSPHHP